MLNNLYDKFGNSDRTFYDILADNDRIYGNQITQDIHNPRVDDVLNQRYMKLKINSLMKFKYTNLEILFKECFENNGYKNRCLLTKLEYFFSNNYNGKNFLASVICMPERDEIILCGSFN